MSERSRIIPKSMGEGIFPRADIHRSGDIEADTGGNEEPIKIRVPRPTSVSPEVTPSIKRWWQVWKKG